MGLTFYYVTIKHNSHKVLSAQLNEKEKKRIRASRRSWSMLEKWIWIFCHMTIFSFPFLSLCCVVPKSRKVVLVCASNKHLMPSHRMVQQQNLVKTTSFAAN